MDEKICTLCKRPGEFNKNPSKRGGLSNVCRTCNRKNSTEYYVKNKKRIRALNTRNKVVNKKEGQQKILAYLADHPCIDCGEPDPVVLEFDHIRGKKVATVGALLATGYKWNRILAEIEKCEVRCANCHRRRHFSKRKTYRAGTVTQLEA